MWIIVIYHLEWLNNCRALDIYTAVKDQPLKCFVSYLRANNSNKSLLLPSHHKQSYCTLFYTQPQKDVYSIQLPFIYIYWLIKPKFIYAKRIQSNPTWTHISIQNTHTHRHTHTRETHTHSTFYCGKLRLRLLANRFSGSDCVCRAAFMFYVR